LPKAYSREKLYRSVLFGKVSSRANHSINLAAITGILRGSPYVQRIWGAVRAFLKAEEVPRWFGLSVVLIYLMGLGAIAHSGVNAMRREAMARIAQGDRAALDALVGQLSVPSDPGSTEQRAAGWNESLRAWAAAMDAYNVRVFDGARRIIASTQPQEIGTTPPPNQPASDAAGGRWLRKAVPTKASQPWIVEVHLPDVLADVPILAASADSAVVVLVGLGALFMVYRCLRGQMKSLAQITNRLQSRAGHLAEDLGSLRLADESDELAQAWNQLIELTQTLSEAVQRSTANEELSRALNKTGGGALAEAMNAIPDGIICMTDEVRFEYMNSTACQMLGWTLNGLFCPIRLWADLWRSALPTLSRDR